MTDELAGRARRGASAGVVASTGLRLAALGLAWIAGIGAQLQQRDVWSWQAYLVMGCGGLVLVLSGVLWRYHFIARAMRPIAAAMLAFALTGGHACWLLSETLDPSLEGADVELIGVIASLPQVNASGARFPFHVESALLDGQPIVLPKKAALGWYRDWNDEAQLIGPFDRLSAGQRWRFTVRLRAPHGNLNPHGFDYELWLFEQGLRFTGYVRATAERPPKQLGDRPGYAIERLRQSVRDGINRQVHDARAAGVLVALAVGDQAAIEREDWDVFRDTGVSHLVSISGLHVTMFAWLAGLLIAALWRRSARLMLWWPTPLAARWGGVLATWAYALFSGWGVPSQRTVWMLATTALLSTSSRRWPWPLVLLSAASVVGLFDPWALLQPGFWLSFMAVGLLMASSPATTQPVEAPPRAATFIGRALSLLRRALSNDLRTQCIATLGLAPLTLVFFQQLSLVGLIANIVAIPLVTLVITPLALLGVIAPPLWQLGGWAVQAFAAYLGWLASWPSALWLVPVVALWAQLAGLLAGALIIMPLPWRIRLLAVPLILPLLWPHRVLPAEGDFTLLAADIGQGTAVLVRTRAHLLVFDSGPQYSRENDAGQRVLVPLLHSLGETHIDRLVLSHRDSDHTGGAASLMKAVPTDELWSSLEAGHRLLKLAPSTTRCIEGQHWRWDGVDFDLMHPRASDYERATIKPNQLSCVLRVRGARHSALLTGDVEKDGEADMVATYGDALQSELLVVPHHGSHTSSSAIFLDTVRPRIAVIQAGYRNRFGHPAPDVVARYRARGIAVFASPACGALGFEPVDAPQETICERETARRYWQHRLPPDATQ